MVFHFRSSPSGAPEHPRTQTFSAERNGLLTFVDKKERKEKKKNSTALLTTGLKRERKTVKIVI